MKDIFIFNLQNSFRADITINIAYYFSIIIIIITCNLTEVNIMTEVFP